VISDTSREVGGFLVGSVADGNATITGHIPALAAVGSRASLTFTHDTWDQALDLLDRDFPDGRLVGWYHSHPGHGVFLSDYDQFIQTNFFSVDGMPALVIDPITGAEGWFKTDGGQAVETARTEGTRPASPRPTGPVPRRRASMVLAVAVGVLVAGTIGYGIGFGASADTSSAAATRSTTRPETASDGADRDALLADLAVARGRVAELEAARVGPGGTVAIFYQAQRGDSLWRIAEAVLGDGNAWIRIRDANPGIGTTVGVGQRIRVPVTPIPLG
ncbi:MAG: hypothetical protein QOJ23_2520, partial [Actinomycetota bacterium]|nr:hypothetical protein [Actinomycetota bacterium]